MPTIPQPPLSPPFNDPALADDGHHADAWQAHHQEVANQLDIATHQIAQLADYTSAQIADLTAQLATLSDNLGVGITDGSDAAAGAVGEYLTATSGGVPLTTGTNTNVISLSLPAGDWDVSGRVAFAATGGPYNAFGAGIGGIDTFVTATFPSAGLNEQLPTATWRRNVTAATTVWVVAVAYFTGSVTATGTIRARRMR